MANWRSRDERRARAEAAARIEEKRRREEPTNDEQMLDRLNLLIHEPRNAACLANDIKELATLLRWHITGEEF